LRGQRMMLQEQSIPKNLKKKREKADTLLTNSENMIS